MQVGNNKIIVSISCFCLNSFSVILKKTPEQHLLTATLNKSMRPKRCCCISLLEIFISTTNHMFGRAISHQLPECIFGNVLIVRVKRGQFQIFRKSRGGFIPQIA